MIETFTPPNEKLDGLPPTNESPCHHDGGFFYSELEKSPITQLPFTPVDELNGVPLPLHPESKPLDSHRFSADEHHPWHPRKDPNILVHSLGGRALRNSRIQVANYDLHHIHYHGRFHGPKLPQTESDLFRLVVLTAAGYIPERAMVFNGTKDPVIKPLSAELRTKLWRGRHIRVGKPAEVQRYLRDYTYRQDLSDINDSTIDEFLSTKSPEKRWELGNQLIGRAVYQATLPLKDAYREAHKTELIPPERARVVSRFVLSSLGMRRNRGLIFDELSNRLASSAA